MPSSISNSKDRVPDGHWRLTWIAAIVLLLFALAGWKVYWTSRGYGMSLSNSATSWAEARLGLRPESTVLLGTSRIQVGIVPEEWAAEMGGEPPLQLALAGTSPVKTLHYLASDTDFRGLAIVGVVEMFMFDADADGSRADEAIAEYHAIMSSPARRAGVALGARVPEGLLVRNQYLNLSGILDAAWKRRAPRNLHANMQNNRWIRFENERLPPEAEDYAEFESSGRPASPAERDSIIADIRASVETIRARGGQVVLVAFPACGGRREIEERRYPRETYWEPLVRAVAPAVTVRCYDIPRLMDFTCTDGSHLDEPDARHFTRELARTLRDSLQGGRPPGAVLPGSGG